MEKLAWLCGSEARFAADAIGDLVLLPELPSTAMLNCG